MKHLLLSVTAQQSKEKKTATFHVELERSAKKMILDNADFIAHTKASEIGGSFRSGTWSEREFVGVSESLKSADPDDVRSNVIEVVTELNKCAARCVGAALVVLGGKFRFQGILGGVQVQTAEVSIEELKNDNPYISLG